MNRLDPCDKITTPGRPWPSGEWEGKSIVPLGTRSRQKSRWQYIIPSVHVKIDLMTVRIVLTYGLNDNLSSTSFCVTSAYTPRTYRSYVVIT